MNKNLADILLSLRPGAKFVTRNNSEIEWLDSEQVQPTQEEIDTERARLQTEYDATEYQRLRAPQYPPIGDQLDALLKHLNYRRTQGDELIQELDDIIGDWLNVKSKYPKG
tara:strand:- start:481 stop:813 length:333 start_codon:yes stop_codon:yes gene_type:complete